MGVVIGVPLRYQELDNRAIIYISERLRRTIQKTFGYVFPIAPVQDVDYFFTKNNEFRELSDEEKLLIDKNLEFCDGIIFPGGVKFTPYDRYLLEMAISKKIPVLGICLGMQMMGCYGEDIVLNAIDEENNHCQKDDTTLLHKVILDKSSRLYKILGREEIMVNSFHKKCITGNSVYKIVGKSEDGVIEAIEYPGEIFNIGVQWHPEISYDFDENSKKIIDAFIDACSEKRKNSLVMETIN